MVSHADFTPNTIPIGCKDAATLLYVLQSYANNNIGPNDIKDKHLFVKLPIPNTRYTNPEDIRFLHSILFWDGKKTVKRDPKLGALKYLVTCEHMMNFKSPTLEEQHTQLLFNWEQIRNVINAPEESHKHAQNTIGQIKI